MSSTVFNGHTSCNDHTIMALQLRLFCLLAMECSLFQINIASVMTAVRHQALRLCKNPERLISHSLIYYGMHLTAAWLYTLLPTVIYISYSRPRGEGLFGICKFMRLHSASRSILRAITMRRNHFFNIHCR